MNYQQAIQEGLSIVDSLGDRITDCRHIHPKDNQFTNLRVKLTGHGEDDKHFAKRTLRDVVTHAR